MATTLTHAFISKPLPPNPRNVIENWRKEYNEERPHSSLKDMTPKEFADGFLPEDSASNPY